MGRKARKIKVGGITLSPENVEYIKKLLDEGHFSTRSAVIEDALTVHRALALGGIRTLKCSHCGEPAEYVFYGSSVCSECCKKIGKKTAEQLQKIFTKAEVK